MIDEKTLQYMNRSEPECEVIEADGRRHVVGKPRPSGSFLQALLFPATLTGLGHIVLFTMCCIASDLLFKFAPGHGHYGGGILGLIVVVELIGYLGYCIRDSAEGGLRAPDSLLMAGGAYGGDGSLWGNYWSLMTQYLGMIFPLFLCFAPACIYVIYARQIDVIFISLFAAALFYFPMFFLAVVLFDSSTGYNPLLHVVSILSTLVSYCILVLQCLVVVGLMIVSFLLIWRSALLGALLTIPVTLYAAMVYMHLLGRFFYQHEEKLRWDV